ncbi:MAG: Ig-like domain-containing protein [Oryzomonas sp.]|jgi:hypothetical protein
MRNLIWSGLVMAVLLSGCGWSGTASRQNTITPLTSITITAAYSPIAQGTSVELTATGNYSGLFNRPISDQVVWTSSATNVANFMTTASPSRVTGLSPGSAVLTATMGGVSATFNMTVSSATISTVTVTPVNPSIAMGLTQQFTATGKFSDGTTQDITFDATWASSNTAVATVSNAATDNNGGLATTVAAGTTTITATFGGVNGPTVLTVTAPVLQSIAVATSNTFTSVLSLSTVTFTATGTYSSGPPKDITSQVAWNSSNTNVAPSPIAGITQTATQGTTNITASLGTVVSNTTTLTVTGGNLVSFILPTTLTVDQNTVAPISVTGITGTFSNGTTRDITGVLNWSVANITPNCATLTGPTGNRLLVNAVATGTATIKAESPTLNAITNLTVSNLALSTFTVSPPSGLALAAGTSGRLTATATFSDGSTQDVTANAKWTSNAPTVATVGTVGPAGVQISGVAAGSANIGVTFGGLTYTAPIPVTVTARTLQSIAVSPGGTQPLTSGQQTSFTAMATYSGGVTQDVTADATWATLNGNIAILADSQNQPGQVIGVGSGSTSLTATFGGLSPANVTINVP